MAFRGWFIGMQDTFSSMLTDVIVNVGNILFSILLTFGIPGTAFNGLGFKGIALGTVVAQYSGLLFAGGRVAIKFRNITGGVSALDLKAAFNGDKVRRFFSVNRDLFIRSVCLIIVYLAFTAISARFGDVLLASCSIMLKLLLVFSYFTDGFAFAGEALTGKFVGVRWPQMVRRTVDYTFGWSMGIGIIFVFIYAVFGMSMVRLLTSDGIVVEATRTFMPWLVLFPLVSCPAFTWDGIYTGATATKAMRDSNIGCVFAFFVVWLLGMFLLRPKGTAAAHLLFAAYYAHVIFRSLYQTFCYRKAILAPIL